MGDEPLIIFNNTNCPVVVGTNRVEAAASTLLVPTTTGQFVLLKIIKGSSPTSLGLED